MSDEDDWLKRYAHAREQERRRREIINRRGSLKFFISEEERKRGNAEWAALEMRAKLEELQELARVEDARRADQRKARN